MRRWMNKAAVTGIYLVSLRRVSANTNRIVWIPQGENARWSQASRVDLSPWIEIELFVRCACINWRGGTQTIWFKTCSNIVNLLLYYCQQDNTHLGGIEDAHAEAYSEPSLKGPDSPASTENANTFQPESWMFTSLLFSPERCRPSKSTTS